MEFKLYAWSIIADPLLFFVILDQNVTGVNLTLARLFQGVFVTVFLLGRLIATREWSFPNPRSPLFINFTVYASLLIAASVVGGLIFGTYTLNLPYTYEYSSFLVKIIRSPDTRPFFEFLILFYYFTYYVVMPRYMVRSRAEFDYLINWIIRMLYIMLIIGLPEVVVNYLGWGYIPKHSVHIEFGYVGERFHALLGEPRDAFPYLLFGLSIVYLRNTVNPERRIPSLLVPAVFVALVMTQSVSGVIGLGLSAVGLLVYFSVKSLRRFLLAVLAIILIAPIVSFFVSLSPRMLEYVDAFSNIWEILNAGEQLPYLVAVQSSNFLTFWNMWLNIKSVNWFPVLLGSGSGATNIVNNNLAAVFIEDSYSDLMNANAQITRILFESGVIGFLIYLHIFIRPVRQFLANYKRNLRTNFILFALLLGASLGHRSSTIFIYLGIVITILSNWSGVTEGAGNIRRKGAEFSDTQNGHS